MRTVYFPDGYYPDGTSRPWREVIVTEIRGDFTIGRYADTGEESCCPTSGIRTSNDPSATAEARRYEAAAQAAGWQHGGDNGGFWFDATAFESWKAAASADDAATYATAREVCEGEGIVIAGPEGNEPKPCPASNPVRTV